MSKNFYMISKDGKHAFRTDHPEWHKDSETVSYKRYAEVREVECRRILKKWLRPGSTVYTKVNHVSRSGMSRSIALYVVDRKTHEIVNISGYASDLCGYSRDKNELAVIMGGCGMDMGFAAVYGLGARMWPKGTAKPHGTRNGEPDTAGGYALKQRWL